MNEELIMKVKSAKSPEALLAIAKENGIALSENEDTIKRYFEQLNGSGEMSDDELDGVSGGNTEELIAKIAEINVKVISLLIKQLSELQDRVCEKCGQKLMTEYDQSTGLKRYCCGCGYRC